MSAPTALYRRYRPDSFADVIGQEHVTAPLMAALDKNRVNHAYLFSGPRGCGKTTSARILARCLNCAQGPTSHPCGVCDSCVELARGGSGSLDVIEIDAASHGGVDDARDLRERATFAPIRDRYKIFIIDEAHMVTSAGFNALLKIVEEPPEHIKFIFATTEPDKVIGTIRSRTHHYPFRLVPPEPLMKYLGQLCEAENVAVAPGVLSLVIRAGGGSVRDSLSVLDQLMAGAGPEGLDYELAVDLLGYTHSSLLDDVVEALAAGDSATVFKAVDRVIQTGHDPRRFVEDLLERFRDLIIVAAMPENAHAILRGTPEELIARMQTQAAQLGPAELSRAADVTNAALNEMTGATSPRLHLELLGARLLLPGADSTTRGMGARLDQMERRLNYGGAPAANAVASGTPPSDPASLAPLAPYSAPAVEAAPSAPGGGLAAVRAQLAKAKADAGAAAAGRPAENPAPAAAMPAASAPIAATTTSAPPAEHEPAVQAPAVQEAEVDSWGIPMQEHRPAPVTQAPVTHAPVAQAPVAQAPVTQAPGVQVPATQIPAQPTSAEQSSPGQNSQGQAAPRRAPSWDDLPTPDAPRQEQSLQQDQPRAGLDVSATAPAPSPETAIDSAPRGGASSEIEMIRRAWPEILNKLSNIRKASWALANQNVVPRAFDGQTLRVALPTTALIQTFQNGGHSDNLRQAIHETLGINCQLDPITGDAPVPGTSAEPNPKGLAEPQRQAQKPADARPADVWPADARPEGVRPSAARSSYAGPVAESVSANPDAESGPTASSAVDVPPAVAEVADAWEEPLPEEPHWDEPPHWDDTPPVDYESSASGHADHSQQSETRPHAALPENQDDSSLVAQQTSDEAHLATESVEATAPAALYRPKVSPISAWTTGWDSPVETPAAAPTPVAPATPSGGTMKRSEMLAAAMAAQANGTVPNQGNGQSNKASDPDNPQDWGAALGAVSRNQVSDPGWGAPAAAPDWATAEGDSAAPEAPASLVHNEQPAQAPGEKMSMYQRLSNSPEAKASRVQSPTRQADKPYVEDVPSPDDVTIEESGKAGQAAVERILGGQLIEERPFGPR